MAFHDEAAEGRYMKVNRRWYRLLGELRPHPTVADWLVVPVVDTNGNEFDYGLLPGEEPLLTAIRPDAFDPARLRRKATTATQAAREAQRLAENLQRLAAEESIR